MELKKVRVRVHPLFWAVGALSAFTGGLLLFLSALLAALEHECAHALMARRYGYTLDRVVLMPYGAVISGEMEGIGRREELAVLAAGPLANLATGIFFVALWWTFPEAYPYTELAAAVSFSLFFVNLLPAYPLDGGRILRLFLLRFGKKKARIAGMVAAFSVCSLLLAYFIWTLFSEPNYSALFFAAALAAGNFGGGRYERVTFSPKKFLHGTEERRVAVGADMTAGEALRFLREDRYLTLLLFDEGKFYAELSEEELLAALGRGDYAAPLASIAAV